MLRSIGPSFPGTAHSTPFILSARAAPSASHPLGGFPSRQLHGPFPSLSPSRSFFLCFLSWQQPCRAPPHSRLPRPAFVFLARGKYFHDKSRYTHVFMPRRRRRRWGFPVPPSFFSLSAAARTPRFFHPCRELLHHGIKWRRVPLFFLLLSTVCRMHQGGFARTLFSPARPLGDDCVSRLVRAPKCSRRGSTCCFLSSALDVRRRFFPEVFSAW